MDLMEQADVQVESQRLQETVRVVIKTDLIRQEQTDSMATLTVSRLASETARDGVDTRKKDIAENEHCEDNLSVDPITDLGQPAVEEGYEDDSCEECGHQSECVFANHLGETFQFCGACYADAREGQEFID